MPLSVGERIGLYEILAPLGAGGMGEVYRARDTKLKRDVALKVLPSIFAREPDRMARFQREAEVLASLNHPNIAHIYGVEERALVMEMVEGESPKGPLPFDDAWKIASQIADALEYAHDRGVVHRDLKPANVKVTPDGVVKLLDFGLAKAFSEPGTAASSDAANSPTLTMGATVAGVILGTAAYMAPEQAKGKSVDKRADIWAFGVVLYELLTGERLFQGEDVSDILAHVLTAKPDFGKVPALARQLLEDCLAKDPKNRLRDIGDAKRLLREEPAVAALAPGSPSGRGWIVALGLLVAALGGLSFVHFRESPPRPEVVRFNIQAPQKATIIGYPAISSDGQQVAFVAADTNGKQMIWTRPLDSIEARSLPGTEGASAAGVSLFWSPDSRSLAFFSGGKLRKIDVSGGLSQALADINYSGGGGSWGPGGMIVIGRGAQGLQKLSDAGGAVTTLMPDDKTRKAYPQFLPDGKHLIYLETTGVLLAGGPLMVTTIDGKEKKQLRSASPPVYFVSDPVGGASGYLLFGQNGSLVAQRFSASSLELTGDLFPIAAQASYFSASQNGAIAYRQNPDAFPLTELTWFDRSGKRQGTVGPTAYYNDVALSPDGRIAVSRDDGDIWILDAAHGSTLTRFTFDPSQDWDPHWLPDGSRLVWSSRRGGPDNIYWRNANGSGPEELAVKSDRTMRVTDISPDGKFLLAQQNVDLWTVPLDPRRPAGERKPTPFVQSPYFEGQGQFSPGVNGPRWVAYTSEASGRFEIYVQSFPPGSGVFQISNNGGVQPRWSRDGKELFYIGLDRKLMAVDVKPGAKFEYGSPHQLFQTRMEAGGGFPYVFRYDVSPDGKHFLVVSKPESEQGTEDSAPITVVLNWPASLKK